MIVECAVSKATSSTVMHDISLALALTLTAVVPEFAVKLFGTEDYRVVRFTASL